MRSRTTGEIERSLFDDGYVSPSTRDELVGEVCADDAGANYDCLRWHGFVIMDKNREVFVVGSMWMGLV